ncbi:MULTISPECIES: cellulase family glycosylhydrolase [Bradyrhizobium]|uniref:cellulase family glycosylhydrolase n=1 Tax=Bradyrhizobium TaxID=374 RepID=UPI00155EDDBD|nr:MULTISPECIES: cellulase family glycosylhydrolase [Bradyrhizobium]MDD1519262.1 hypothetical protein [Bradyrhizobium sp. WBAH30]MDD1543506.1 hypothetical protein [Bradyrhizobium sp. WBAH41]MDD1557636.1 hypothetical protein [Bradyrhizobium sp. WBAH23]MDD1565049.1 hypothetical protein [Bradyrhizobium sp. WBAH33]MDD1590456.1 hypothetical protein [Bradyrhizobium sp. WBAH42]
MTRPRTLLRDNVLRLAGLISVIVLSVPACAQPLDARFLLGVGTHQGLGGPVSARGYVPAENIAQIKQLGLNAFRDDFPWSDFETAGRRMGFTPRLGRLEAQVRSGIARPMLILAFGHHLVPNSSPPTTDEARQRFADYAAAAAQSVVAQHPLFELWNEWNLAAKKDAAFSPENYLALAQVARPAVKRAAPNAPFLVGALGDDLGWAWTEKMLRTGILQYADGASIHLYNFCMGPSKRTSAEIIERLTAFHRLVGQASGNPDFPVYVTETGWTTASNKCGVSEQAQADNSAQLILWASTAARWLKGIWLYELKDSGQNPSELEHNFGLYRFDNSPKPVACAVQGAWAFIRSSLSAEKRELASGVVSINATTTSGARVAVWSEAPDRRYEVRLKGDQEGATFALPCDSAARPASGAWIPVSSTPVLIAASNGAMPSLEIRPAR